MSAHRPEPPDSRHAKAALRQAIKAAIARLDPAERQAQEDALIARCRQLPGLREARNILLFVPSFPEEPPVIALFSSLIEMKKVVYFPRVDKPGRRLILCQVADPVNDFSPGTIGIPEPRLGLREVAPEVIDWALVPGLAFDEQGFRLGRGGGYYDRLLPMLRPDAICWAVCLNCQLVSRLPVEAHDAPLNGVSTPTREIQGLRGA